MNSRDDVEYRIKLAQGFFKEAAEDIKLKRWRSCYGEESSYTLPWDIFDEDSAQNALKAAKQCKQAAEEIIKQVQSQRAK